jgi:ABC-type antimicrobial peptide transport system permease subunit
MTHVIMLIDSPIEVKDRSSLRGAGRTAESLLFGLSGYDPAVLAAATVVLGAVVLAAGHLPARHASKVDPLEALRYE